MAALEFDAALRGVRRCFLAICAGAALHLTLDATTQALRPARSAVAAEPTARQLPDLLLLGCQGAAIVLVLGGLAYLFHLVGALEKILDKVERSEWTPAAIDERLRVSMQENENLRKTADALRERIAQKPEINHRAVDSKINELTMSIELIRHIIIRMPKTPELERVRREIDGVL